MKNNKKYLFFLTTIIFLTGLIIFYYAIFASQPPVHFPRDIAVEELANNDLPADLEFAEEYNVIVAGTDPEGITAAVASARNGLKTLLIDERQRPGGLFVKGKLNTLDMNYNPEGKIITQGIFTEFYDQLEGTSFNTETAETVFRNMIDEEENLDWVSSAELVEPLFSDDEFLGLKTKQKGEEVNYRGERLIDATVNADLAAQAGAPYFTGMEDINRGDEFQVSTLVFELTGVDWEEARNYLNSDGDPNTGGDNRSLWGFSAEMQEYESKDPDIMVRGLNVGRQEGSRVLINSVHILDVDPTDPESRQEGKEKAREEIPHIVRHIQEKIPGFAEVELYNTAEELYLRAGRHIKARETLTIDDVREHRDFSTKIALGSYPVDIQRTARDNQGFILFDPAKYSIPFGSLIPRKIENVLVVGKAAGYDSLAHGSARVVPVGMAAGEAAGVASRLSLEERISFSELAESEDLIKELQNRLIDQGAYLDDFSYSFAGEDSWALPGIRFMNQLGLLIGGYDNDFALSDKMSTDEFSNRLRQVFDRYFALSLDLSITDKLSATEYPHREEVEEIFKIIKEEEDEFSNNKNDDESWLSDDTIEKIPADKELTREEAYQVIKELSQHLKNNKNK